VGVSKYLQKNLHFKQIALSWGRGPAQNHILKRTTTKGGHQPHVHHQDSPLGHSCSTSGLEWNPGQCQLWGGAGERGETEGTQPPLTNQDFPTQKQQED
jgi:hypothetical protein